MLYKHLGKSGKANWENKIRIFKVTFQVYLQSFELKNFQKKKEDTILTAAFALRKLFPVLN